MVQIFEIPHNADKMLFAEDFMRFMTFHENQGFYECQFERYRPYVNIAFSESVQKAVRILHAQMVGFPAARTIDQRIGEYTTDLYMEFTNEMINYYFPNGFRVNNFLTFCVRVTSMAAFFYTREVLQAPILAVHCIYNIFRDFDMTTGGWDLLQSTAEIVVLWYANTN